MYTTSGGKRPRPLVILIGSYPIYFTSASLSNTLMFPFILNTHILYNPIDRYCQVM